MPCNLTLSCIVLTAFRTLLLHPATQLPPNCLQWRLTQGAYFLLCTKCFNISDMCIVSYYSTGPGEVACSHPVRMILIWCPCFASHEIIFNCCFWLSAPDTVVHESSNTDGCVTKSSFVLTLNKIAAVLWRYKDKTRGKWFYSFLLNYYISGFFFLFTISVYYVVVHFVCGVSIWFVLTAINNHLITALFICCFCSVWFFVFVFFCSIASPC